MVIVAMAGGPTAFITTFVIGLYCIPTFVGSKGTLRPLVVHNAP